MTSPFAPPSSDRSQPARSAASGLLLLGLLATPPAMAGQQPPIDLRWEAPTGCPQESDVRSRIQKILGPGHHDSPLRAEGTITRIESRFHLELVVRVGEIAGTRSLTARSCDDLAGAAAVEIGLLVHSVEAAGKPDGAAKEPLLPLGGLESSGFGAEGASGGTAQGGSFTISPSREPDGAKPERKPDGERDVEKPPALPETPRRWRGLLQAPILALGAGPVPPLALGAGLALGFEHARWRVQVQGLYWRRQNVPASGFPGYGVDVDRMGASLLTCHELLASWFGLSPCISAGMERVSARGTGSNILPTGRHTIGVSAGAGLQGRIHLTSWLRLVAAAGVEIVFVRPQYLIQWLGPLDPDPALEDPAPPTPVFRFAPAAVAGTLGLEWAL